MPRFSGNVNRPAIESVLTQLKDIKNQKATLRIKQTKGNISIRSNSAQGKFRGFAIKKSSLVKKTITEQADLVNFINTACRNVGLVEEISDKNISAAQGTKILSKVMNQYKEQDRQSLVMSRVLQKADRLGNDESIRIMMEHENDLTFLTQLNNEVSENQNYSGYDTIIENRIKELSSKDQKTVQFDSASNIDKMTDEELSTNIFSELKVKTGSMLKEQKMLFMDEVMEKKVRFASDEAISKIPQETAVILPTAKGEKSQRLHGNYVQLSPNEPITIATQAPKPAAMGDFWLAGFSHNAKVIVDLTQISEVSSGAIKVYYPEGPDDLHFESGGIKLRVSLKSKKDHPENSDIKISTYLVVNDQGEQKEISRVHFTNWVDHNGVDPAVLNQLIDTVDDISGQTGLVMAHCRAGVGRTGTFTTGRTAKHRLAGKTLSSSQIKDEILALGMKGRTQRNQVFIQKIPQMVTLVKFLRNMNKTNVPQATKSDDKNVNPARNVPPVIPPRRSSVPLSAQQFWMNYSNRIDTSSKLTSAQIWKETVNDMKNVSSNNREHLLNDFEKMQSGLKSYLLHMLK